MGREVRKVPPNWQHPKDDRDGSWYRPLFDGSDYQTRVASWNKAVAERGLQGAIDYEVNPPDANDFMPVWPDSERTHYMMYETTTEGTPISPAFSTPEELARWLTESNASANGYEGASYESWLRVCKGGYAPLMVLRDGELMSGVAGIES